jgi:hypothetical protein
MSENKLITVEVSAETSEQVLLQLKRESDELGKQLALVTELIAALERGLANAESSNLGFNLSTPVNLNNSA